MSGTGYGISGVGIAGLKFSVNATRRISRSSIGGLSTNWSRSRNSLAHITKLTGINGLARS